MRSRSLLFLMEQLVMLLVFALAAAICLQVFVRADGLSRENAVRSLALCEAQDTAERIKVYRGVDAAAQQLDAVPEEDGFSLYLDAAGEPCEADAATLRIVVKTEAPGQAVVTAYLADGTDPLITLSVGWQEEL